jgi:hypothetical protein
VKNAAQNVELKQGRLEKKTNDHKQALESYDKQRICGIWLNQRKLGECGVWLGLIAEEEDTKPEEEDSEEEGEEKDTKGRRMFAVDPHLEKPFGEPEKGFCEDCLVS